MHEKALHLRVVDTLYSSHSKWFNASITWQPKSCCPRIGPHAHLSRMPSAKEFRCPRSRHAIYSSCPLCTNVWMPTLRRTASIIKEDSSCQELAAQDSFMLRGVHIKRSFNAKRPHAKIEKGGPMPKRSPKHLGLLMPRFLMPIIRGSFLLFHEWKKKTKNPLFKRDLYKGASISVRSKTTNQIRISCKYLQRLCIFATSRGPQRHPRSLNYSEDLPMRRWWFDLSFLVLILILE